MHLQTFSDIEQKIAVIKLIVVWLILTGYFAIKGWQKLNLAQAY